MKQITNTDNHKFAFKISDCQVRELIQKELMVDTGATPHIIMDIEKSKTFDELFQLENHSIELADRTRMSRVTLRRGDVGVCLKDSEGHKVKTTLTEAL